MAVTKKIEKPFIFRQAQYLADLAQKAEQHFNGPQQAEWYEKLEQEYPNLKLVLEWFQEKAVTQNLQPGELRTLLRLASTLWRFWQVRGHLAEGQDFLQEILKVCGQDNIIQFPALRAKILHGAGVLASVQGDFYRPISFFEESLRLRRRLRDRAGITACLNNLGILALYQHEYERASALLTESLALRRQQGDKWGTCNTLTNLGNVKIAQNDYTAAAVFLEESLSIGRELGDKRSIAICLYNLGNIALQEKSTSKALNLFKESLAIRQELGDKVGLAECLEGLAGFKELSGHSEKAACLLGAAAFLRETIGAPLEPVDFANYYKFKEQTRVNLGSIAFEENWTLGNKLRYDQAFEYAFAS